MKRPFALYPLLLVHLFVGAGALYGGWMLMTAPIGFGMNPEWLAASPFENYFLPGIFLFTCLGMFSLFVASGLLLQPVWPWANTLNVYRRRHWAWTYSLYLGIMLIAWIAVQITFVPNFWLQPVMLAAALLILILTLLPTMERHFSLQNGTRQI